MSKIDIKEGEPPINNRLQWFQDRIGKYVYQKGSTAHRPAFIDHSGRALMLYNREQIAGNNGKPLFFDTLEEAKRK